MSSYADLLDVSFMDVTAHANSTTGDILGVVMPYFTGPSGEKHVYDRSEFYEKYPESLPGGCNPKDFPNDYFDAYAQVKKYFDNGGKQVEVFVPNDHLYFICCPDAKSSVIAPTGGSGTIEDCEWMITWKYPGLPAASDLTSGAKSIKIYVTDSLVEISVSKSSDYANANDWIVLESFQGQFDNENDQVDGQYTHFKHVLNQSLYLQCVAFNDPKYKNKLSATFETAEALESGSPKTLKFEIAGQLQSKVIGKNKTTTTKPNTELIGDSENGAMYEEAEYAAFYRNQFSDLDTTQCTMLIEAPWNSSVRSEIVAAVEGRHNCVGFVSAARDKEFDSNISVFEAGNDKQVNTPLQHSKFLIAVAGTETLTLFGSNYYLNCVGGVCGAYANIAKQVRLNQVASARTYGAYVGNLLYTANFGQVLDLHEKGIVTVYTSSKGPQIFGVHNTLYVDNKNSYFATNNVSRVVAALLYDIQPLLLDAIHTDSAANPISRSILVTKCNSIVNDHIGRQNLQADSAFYATDAMNTDTLTKGGRRLNCILKCHFIGLVETISLKVVATDSSVTVDVLSM